MDLGKVLGDLGGDKAKDAIDLVWKNKDKLEDVSKLVGEHREALWNLVTTLPKLLNNIGENIEAAGKGALATGQTLVGETGASALLKQGADTLAACQQRLASVNSVAQGAVKQLTKVPMISGPAKELAESVDGIGDIAKQLKSLCENLSGLSSIMNTAGAQLTDVGQQLSTSGTSLRSFTS